MQRYGVLVVDDSSFMRRSISLILERDPQFFIAGIARDGVEAIEKVQRLKPDIVTMDVEMPEMDGLTALKKIMEISPVPVVMLSNYTEEGADITIRALEQGAVDFFLKSELIGHDVEEKTINNFLRKLKMIVESARVPHREVKGSGGKDAKSGKGNFTATGKSVDLVIIGASTGGPAALQSILPFFPKDTRVPILVLQHMPPGFTKSLAERFDTFCSLHVKEAENGDVLEAGKIYIAPAGFQTTFSKGSDDIVRLRVKDMPNEKTLYKPSVNITLNSAAPIYRDRLLTVILTGMGNDGLAGCRTVKKYNGHVIVESEESCIVYGMPKAIYEAGLADIQVALPDVFGKIMLYI